MHKNQLGKCTHIQEDGKILKIVPHSFLLLLLVAVQSTLAGGISDEFCFHVSYFVMQKLSIWAATSSTPVFAIVAAFALQLCYSISSFFFTMSLGRQLYVGLNGDLFSPVKCKAQEMGNGGGVEKV